MRQQMSSTTPATATPAASSSSNDDKASAAGTHSLNQMRQYYEQYAAHYRDFVEPTNTCLGMHCHNCVLRSSSIIIH
jgi:hypothetical protein